MFGINFLLLVYICLYDLFINSKLSLPINRYLFNFKDISIFPKHIFITCSTPSPSAYPSPPRKDHLGWELSKFCKNNGIPYYAAPNWKDPSTFGILLPAGTDSMEIIKKMINFHIVSHKENTNPKLDELDTTLRATVIVKVMDDGRIANFLAVYYKHPYKNQIEELTFLFKQAKEIPLIGVIVSKINNMNLVDAQYTKYLYSLAYKIPRDKKFTKMRNPGPLRRQLMNVPHFSETDLPKSVLKDDSLSDDLESEEIQYKVYFPKDKRLYKEYTWDLLEGFDDTKKLIQGAIHLSLRRPVSFADLLETTVNNKNRKTALSRLKVLLFQGPPGTGKTTSAKIIGEETTVPMIYLSRHDYFQYSKKIKKLIRKVFRDAIKFDKEKELCVIFFDDIDLLAASSDNGSTQLEAILSFLTDRIDEIKPMTGRIRFIAATNKPQNLSKAFLDRVYLKINFPLPTNYGRVRILERYAGHLNDTELESIADITEGFSGGRLEELCRSAQRMRIIQWIVRDSMKPVILYGKDLPPPPVEMYLQAAREEASS